MTATVPGNPSGPQGPDGPRDTASPASADARRARRHSIRNAFDKAADSYDAAALIQRQIGERLGAFATAFDLRAARSNGARVLDAGCGTGFGLPILAQLCPAATLLSLDLAPTMLARARQRHDATLTICGDLEHLPLRAHSLGLLWSSLAMQWCAPASVLAESARVLAPGGVALIATLGPRSLFELREAFAAIDHERHTIDFHPTAAWCAAAQAAGLIVEGTENLALPALAPDLRGLLKDIKAIGAATVDGERRRRPLGRSAWQRLEAHYERHRRADGQLPATYDLILLALRQRDPATR